MKDWNAQVFGDLDCKIQELTDKIAQLDLLNKGLGLRDEEVHLRKSAWVELWDLMRNKTSLAQQNSRIRWLYEGDANSKFFHAYIRSKRFSNHISALLRGNGWVGDIAGVKNEVVCFSSKHFAETQ